MALSLPPPDELNPVDAAMARLGTQLNVAWILDDVLGIGDTSVVFAATHTSGARAALKVLYPELSRDADVRDRFLREGKIAAHIHHPGRVHILGEGVSDRGEPFLIMELLVGTTLHRWLKRAGGTLPVEQVLPIFDAVLDLLDQCHSAGIVHHDIKPTNIFVTEAGQVKLLDFGTARVRDPERQAARAGQTFGASPFMAPEQAMGLDDVDSRADLWSVGACIYAALTGKQLHDGRGDPEAYMIAAAKQTLSIAHAAPHLPAEIVAFVDRALAFERPKRFQSAAAMRNELRVLHVDHAAGRLKPGAVARVPSVVVRGNDMIEEGAAPLRGVPAEQAYQRLVGIWKQLGLLLRSARQYGFSHPYVLKGLQPVFEEVTRALAEAPLAVRWDVTPGVFVFDERPIWQPDRPPLDRIPYQLFADGIRTIQLKPGITDVELRDLAAILLADRSFGGEDSVTALWDRRFEHVVYFAVDASAEGEAAEREAFEEQYGKAARALAHIEGPSGGESPEGRALGRNLEGALNEAAQNAAALAVDPGTRAALGAELFVSADQWRERYVDAFVEGYLDALHQGDAALMTSALTDWTADQIALHDYALAFETLAALRWAFTARAELSPPSAPLETVHRTLTAAMFPPGALRAILANLTAFALTDPGALIEPSLASQPPPPSSVNSSIAEGLAQAFDALGDGALFGAACSCYGAVQSERLRQSLRAYMARWAPGREAERAELLPRAPGPRRLAVIELLMGLRTPEAFAAFEAGFESPHLEVRLSALAGLSDSPMKTRGAALAGDRIREEIQKLLDDARPASRIEALRAIAKFDVVAAGPALVRRILAADFHGLGVDERRQWLETVGRLNPNRAERLAIELLEKRQLIPSESTEQTRELAARVLSQLGRSHEALNAVKEATKPRWWNTQPVRDTATRAVAAIAARLVVPRRGSDPPARSLPGRVEMPPSPGRLGTSTAPPAPLPPVTPPSPTIPSLTVPSGRGSSAPPAPAVPLTQRTIKVSKQPPLPPSPVPRRLTPPPSPPVREGDGEHRSPTRVDPRITPPPSRKP